MPYLRPDGKTQVTIEYDGDRAVRLDTVVVSSQHAADIGLESMLQPDIAEQVVKPVLDGLAIDTDGLPAAGQPDRPLRDRRPDGRRRPDRPQDHRRHLRRHGPPRRRRVLRQGPVQGRPLGRLRHALGRQERRGRRPGPALRGAGRLRDRQGAPGRAVRRDLRHRDRAGRADPGRGRPRSSTCARPRSSATSTCCARSTRRPPPTATSAGSCPTSPGSAPTGSTRCAPPPAPDRSHDPRVGPRRFCQCPVHGAAHGRIQPVRGASLPDPPRPCGPGPSFERVRSGRRAPSLTRMLTAGRPGLRWP